MVSIASTVLSVGIETLPAQAITLYTSKTAFNNATTGLTEVTFEGLIPPDTASELPNGTVISGVTFSSPQYMFIVNCATSASFIYGNCQTVVPLTGFTTIAGTGTFPNPITAALPTGITAVGVDLLPYNIPTEYTIAISTGDSYTLSVGNEVSFVGFTSETPISFLTISANNANGIVFDNLTYGQAQSIPEPLTLLGTGTALGFGTVFKGKLSKKQQKDKTSNS